ncbi:MAG: hypothetical protein R6V40_00270, partial [Candidatus Moraniibacteriota bacterium]
MSEATLGNKIKGLEKIQGSFPGQDSRKISENDSAGVEKEKNEMKAVQEVISEYLNDDIKDLYALDYVSGSKSVWDLLDDEEKVESKRKTQKYKKYCEKFEEEIYGDGGLAEHLQKKAQSGDIQLEKRGGLEKEIIEYLHKKNLKKPLRFMVYDILEKEKLGEEQSKDIEDVFRDYKYSSGSASKKALEKFLDKFLKRREEDVEESEESGEQAAIQSTSSETSFADLTEKKREEAPEKEKDSTLQTRGVSVSQKDGKSENAGGQQENKEADFREEEKPDSSEVEKPWKRLEKYKLNAVYSNHIGDGLKIKDFSEEDNKVTVEIYPSPFEMTKEKDEDGSETNAISIKKDSSEASYEERIPVDEFEDWFKKEGFRLEAEDEGRDAGNEEGGKETEGQEPIVQKDEVYKPAEEARPKENNEQQRGLPKGGKEENAEQEKNENNIEERLEKIKGMNVDRNGEVVIVREGGKKGEVKLQDGKAFPIEKVENFFQKGGFKRFNAVKDYINELKEDVLFEDVEVKFKKDRIEVLNYYYDEKDHLFRAIIKDNNEERVVPIGQLRERLDNIENRLRSKFIKKYGEPGKA